MMVQPAHRPDVAALFVPRLLDEVGAVGIRRGPLPRRRAHFLERGFAAYTAPSPGPGAPDPAFRTAVEIGPVARVGRRHARVRPRRNAHHSRIVGVVPERGTHPAVGPGRANEVVFPNDERLV